MDYQKGKIYKIESDIGPKIYIGSTTKDRLSQRMASHRGDYCKWKSNNSKYSKITSFELFEEYGVANCKIILPANTALLSFSASSGTKGGSK